MLSWSKTPIGKLRKQDVLTARVLTWVPWLLTALAIVPLPVFFVVLFFLSSSTDSAAFYLVLSLVSLGLGFFVALLFLVMFWFYRRAWSRGLRNRLAADGITAAEMQWFHSELSSEEKNCWQELEKVNPLLADAFAETLAARLTATRIAARARGEILRIERQINHARHLRNVDTAALLTELTADREQADSVCKEAQRRLAEAKARLQAIDAAGRRALNQSETTLMLRRLSSWQNHVPLALELARLEQEAKGDLDAPTDRNDSI